MRRRQPAADLREESPTRFSISEVASRRIVLVLLVVAVSLCAIGVIGAVKAWDVPNEQVWGFRGFGFLAALVFALSGALLAYKRPQNPIGWLFTIAAVAFAGLSVADVYAGIPLIQGRDEGLIYPLAWFASWSWVTFMASIAFAVLLFPTGHLPSPRWRIPMRLMIVAFTLAAVSFAIGPGVLNNYPEHVTNRYALPPGPLADLLLTVGMIGLVVATAAAAAGVVIRFRSSQGLQRQQMKLFALAAAVMGLSFLLMPLAQFWLEALGDTLEVVSSLAMMSMPVAMTIAILRYRLYDIDVIINRALVYAALTALLAGAYLVLILLAQFLTRPIAADSDIAVAGSTLAVAALFRPLRARVQSFIDKRFYRRRYDAALTLDSFTTKLRDQVSLRAIQDDVVQVVSETVQPSSVSLVMLSEGGP